jgi:hypothetical protein
MDTLILILLVLLGSGALLASYVLVYKEGLEVGHREGFSQGWERKARYLRDKAWVDHMNGKPRARTTIYSREEAARYGGNEDQP